MSTPYNANQQQPYGQQPQQPYVQQPPPGYQGGQQPYGQQPPPGYGYPQQPPPLNRKQSKALAKASRPWFKKKRTWLGALLALIVISVIAQSGGNDPQTAAPAPAGDGTKVADTDTTAPATKAPATKAPAATNAPETTKTTAPAPAKLPGVGEKVEAGDWAFTVSSLKCGVKKVGDQYLGKKAQGQFCLLNIKVANNGSDAATLMGSNQKLLDKDGRTFSSDDEAGIYADTDNNLLSTEINPGNTLKGVVVFDIPKSAKPVEADLAGGFFGIKDVAKIDVS